MHFFQLISLFLWSVACSSTGQGESHGFIVNATTPHANFSINGNVSSNANISTTANLPTLNFTNGFDPKSRAATVQNLQTFTGALGDVQAPPILMSSVQGRPFMVQGDTFPDFATAGSRTCDQQYNGCADAANRKNAKGSKNTKGPKDNMVVIRAAAATSGEPRRSDGNANSKETAAANANAGSNSGNALTIPQCDTQKTACMAAQKNAPFQSFNLENVGPDPAMPDYDLLCAP